MAWITPKTDWLETDRATYTDINRIAGNINEICETSLKDNYTQDDVVSLSEFEAFISALETKAETVKYEPEEVLTVTTMADSFNALEGYTLGLKEWIDILARQQSAYIYLGDDLYLGDEIYLR